VPQQCGVGFQHSQLALSVVEPSTYRSPHILILGIGNASKRQQVPSRLIIYLKSSEYLFDVNDAGIKRLVSMRLTLL
jgi:hypothetical protein